MNSWHLSNYTDWVVDRDMSVAMPRDLKRQEHYSSYSWRDIEVKAPALWATEKSFEEVHRVVTALARTFWILTPEQTGLHIHYGRGKDWIPFNDLRRIGTFLFAADPILCQLHPAHRRNENPFCYSNRNYSGIAHGMPPRAASAHIGVMNEESPEEVPAPRPNPVSTSRPELQRGSAFTSIFRRGELGGYIFDPAEYQLSRHDWIKDIDLLPGDASDRPIEIPVAARGLLRTLNAQTLSYIMEHESYERMAYNFAAYNQRDYRVLHVSLQGTPDMDGQPKRTIEFRQPAGTMNADEVVAHTKIAIRLCEYASQVPLDDLWKMILDFTQAEQHGDWYDVQRFVGEAADFPSPGDYLFGAHLGNKETNSISKTQTAGGREICFLTD
ncbi:hypothetical protein F4677DRAFT_458635 [Hypoxylon crocopeplum]|nr:hypothetical protein F4677DRAFT_458635 [Hypoxylon crocopeplum]